MVRVHLSPLEWGRSSVGRAPALQAGGQEFESRIFHHNPLVQVGRTCATIVLEHGMGSSPLRIKNYLYMVWSAINIILMYARIVH